jgi:hypothetical protein
MAENSEGVSVQLWNNSGRDSETVQYDFIDWDEAIEALPNLPEVE